MSEEQVLNTLDHHLPIKAVDYCFKLWREKPFSLKITKSRQTKIGDFTSHKNATHPRITINHDLSVYSFLITYIHEVAHLEVHTIFGHRAEAHGGQWKKTFQQLMDPVLNEDVFPADLLLILKRHMANPKASSFSDTELTAALRKYDRNYASIILLSEIPEGSVFGLHGRWFKKGKQKRTRVMCREVNTKRDYLVPVDAPVSGAQLSFL
ncbi:MAG: transcription elongation protein SprT [Bacteroidia bacterium]|nr:transcription elongation protein SprT [Bacteroidia bacterium]